jgi:hypothetical protein
MDTNGAFFCIEPLSFLTSFWASPATLRKRATTERVDRQTVAFRAAFPAGNGT